LAAGAAGSVAALLGERTAWADQATTTTSTTTPETGASTSEATTTTLPPRRPSSADIPLLVFAESVELAARDLYGDAIAAGAEDDAILVMRENHRAYADALHGMLGTNANGTRDESLYSQYAGQFKVADAATLAGPAYELESSLVATHTELLGQLVGTDPARLVASILIVEARHCVVLADIAGKGADFDALFENTAEALTPPAGG
jgi:hypothetical protein